MAMLTVDVGLRDRPVVTAPPSPLLAVEDLTTEFQTRAGPLRAVDHVSFELPRGRALAIIGESGSGKSALLRTILGIQPASARVSGRAMLDARDVLQLPRKEREALRGRDIAMVFQDPMTALDPVFTIAQQLTETLRRHLDVDRSTARERALQLLEAVQIPSPEERLDAYPFELSGGMRQRVVIAMALACEPVLLLADEPTTALDVTVQARVLRLIRRLQLERHMGMILVTHDLAVAAQVADDVAVMYAGRLVEAGPVAEVLRAPAHPYTRGLLGANVTAGQTEAPAVIPGAPPTLTRLPEGCAFAPRCMDATVTCWHRRPGPSTVGTARWVSCHNPLPVAVPAPGRRSAIEEDSNEERSA
jgi:oligopeptide/dipeptide ABC transporter ATP-binding protein